MLEPAGNLGRPTGRTARKCRRLLQREPGQNERSKRCSSCGAGRHWETASIRDWYQKPFSKEIKEAWETVRRGRRPAGA